MQQMSHPQYAINMGGTLIHAGFQNGFHWNAAVFYNRKLHFDLEVTLSTHIHGFKSKMFSCSCIQPRER
jgi:hypothetical protein